MDLLRNLLVKIKTFILDLTLKRKMPQAWNLPKTLVCGADFQKTKFGRVWYGTLDDWDKNLHIVSYILYLFSGDFV